ncbi:MAG: hypothetical protein E7426_07180 [Ruminococcaceae bacterium]|jgi:hypothetical protein|nr:hypothetical protein [Oscillospiraceae bacterium]
MEQDRSYEQMDSRELLAELVRCQKKETRHARWSLAVSLLLAVAVVAAVVVVLPRGVAILDHMEQSLQQVDTFVAGANKMISDNTDTVTEAVTKLNGLDFDALNRAIQDLSDAVEPLAKFARLFQ